MVVYLEGGSGFRDLATRVADDGDHAVVTDRERLGEYEEHAYVVAPFEQVDERLLGVLQDRLVSKGPTAGGFGLVSAVDRREAWELYRRGDDESTRTKDLLCTFDEDYVFEEDERTDAVDQIEVERIRELSEAGLRSVSLNTAGWSIHVRIGTGFLCGFPSDASTSEFDGRQPYCVDSGNMDCPLGRDLVHADRLDASHVFLDSCASIIDNNVTSPPVHLGLRLLSSVETLVGSYSVSPADRHEAILNHALLLDGYTAAERCYVLCRNAENLAMKTRPYVLFGDPASRVGTPRRSGNVALESTESGYRATVAPNGRRVVDLSIPEPGADRVYVRAADSEALDREVYYSSFSEDGSHRILVYSPRPLDAPRLTFDVRTSPPGSRAFDQAREVLAGVRAGRAFGVTNETLENKIGNLENQLVPAARERAESRSDTTVAASLESRAEDLRNDVTSIHDTVLEVVNRWDHFHKTYASRIVPHEARLTGDRCHICGREIFANVFADPTGTRYRALGNCPRCGFLYDVPVTDLDDLRYPVVTGELLGVTGDTTTCEVRFETGDGPTLVRIAPMVCFVDDRREPFTPTADRFDADAGDTVSARFTLDVTGIEPNSYYLRGAVLANGRVWIGSHLLVVGERFSRRPEI